MLAVEAEPVSKRIQKIILKKYSFLLKRCAKREDCL